MYLQSKCLPSAEDLKVWTSTMLRLQTRRELFRQFRQKVSASVYPWVERRKRLSSFVSQIVQRMEKITSSLITSVLASPRSSRSSDVTKLERCSIGGRFAGNAEHAGQSGDFGNLLTLDM
jgi:hypothetical protein